MLSILSISLIVLFTIYSIFYTYKRKEQLTCMAGMMVAMTIGMMSSIGLGVILGVILHHDLTISTIIAILFGMFAGYLAGKTISLMAAMDGMLAGIMGGMMGAMLGVMLITSDIMILFVDIIFIFIMSILNQLIDDETGKARSDNRILSKPVLGSALTLIVGILLVGVLLFVQNHGNAFSNQSQPSTTEVQTTSEGNEGFQIATIEVNPTGYEPQNIEIRAGVPTKINFKTDPNAGCLRQVVSKELNINAILQEGDNYITLKNVKPGTYQYTCGMGMYGGTITVK
ncbi:cupredoxin domain-containing protein [Bacillus smithii]|uniref:cupredoxin domain-containing protein n=1 Tax=Bacillus smithii TaxID=1479 RepID=UPI003D1B4AA2